MIVDGIESDESRSVRFPRRMFELLEDSACSGAEYRPLPYNLGPLCEKCWLEDRCITTVTFCRWTDH